MKIKRNQRLGPLKLTVHPQHMKYVTDPTGPCTRRAIKETAFARIDFFPQLRHRVLGTNWVSSVGLIITANIKPSQAGLIHPSSILQSASGSEFERMAEEVFGRTLGRMMPLWGRMNRSSLVAVPLGRQL